MNYTAFTDKVKVLIGADADRMGAEAIIDGFLRLAVIDIQKLHPALKSASSLRISLEDVIDDGFACLCPGPRRPIERVWIIDTESAEDPSLCARRMAYYYPWNKRYDLTKGRIQEGNLHYCQSPDYRQVILFPALTEAKIAVFEYTDVLRDFQPDTELDFPEEAVDLAYNYVRSQIAYELDKDRLEGDRFFTLYRRSRKLLYSDLSS